MPAGDRLIQTMKKVSVRANPNTKSTDLIYGVVQSVSPLTVLVDNRLELTEDYFVLSPFCYKAGFTITVPAHSHGITISPIEQAGHSHITDLTIEGHTHKLEDKETSPNDVLQIKGLKSDTAGDFKLKPTASCTGNGGHKVEVTLWGDLVVGDRLVMLRVAEGQAYLILQRDRLEVKVACQDL